MGKKLTVDELLSEYNKQLDSFNADSLMEETKKAMYLEQAQAELERAEQERLEREKLHYQPAQELEQEPVIEEREPAAAQPSDDEQPVTQSAFSRANTEQTVEFDSQPMQWELQEQYECIYAIADLQCTA